MDKVTYTVASFIEVSRMEQTILGRTGLAVSVAGLGCGGHSRLGMARGEDQSHAESIVKHALDLGINYIDTARAYGTEEAVGNAIEGTRENVVISTKTLLRSRDGPLTAEGLTSSLEKSLARLKTDYIDVYNLHGVTLDQYDHCMEVLLPEMLKQQSLGKIRYLGVTEHFGSDTDHKMLDKALADDYFDVIMVGFNLLNPCARKNVFPRCIEQGVATQIMFAVRRALSNHDALLEEIDTLIDNGQVNAEAIDRDDPLGFLAQHPDVKSVVEAAYRFCRYEPGSTVVLTGTGSKDHLTENVESILADPLSEEISEKLELLFGEVDSVSGN